MGFKEGEEDGLTTGEDEGMWVGPVVSGPVRTIANANSVTATVSTPLTPAKHEGVSSLSPHCNRLVL